MVLEELNLKDGLEYAFCSDLGAYHIFWFCAQGAGKPIYRKVGFYIL